MLQTEYVIVEVCLFAQMYDIIHFMKSQGFVAYDIVDLGYRPSDAALWQVDMAFVKEFGQFRKDTSYVAQQQDVASVNSYLHPEGGVFLIRHRKLSDRA